MLEDKFEFVMYVARRVIIKVESDARNYLVDVGHTPDCCSLKVFRHRDLYDLYFLSNAANPR